MSYQDRNKEPAPNSIGMTEYYNRQTLVQLRLAQGARPSRELAIAITKAEELQMWVEQHQRVIAEAKPVEMPRDENGR